MSDWLKVMLEEIARKEAEAEAAREETERRLREKSRAPEDKQQSGEGDERLLDRGTG